jgi:hypothetical protein
LAHSKNDWTSWSFHGLARFYRRSVKDFSTFASTLNKLTKKNVLFMWKKEQQQSFDELKKRLTKIPLLVLPDFSRTFKIECDVNGIIIGGVLTQNGLPVANHSEKLDAVVSTISFMTKNCMLLFRFLQVWQHYLGQKNS